MVASKEAADATQIADYIAAGGAFLSFGSVILVLFALRQGRQANRISMKGNARATLQAIASADNADKALEHARQTNWKQLRPYIGIENVVLRPVRDAGDVLAIDESREIIISLKNYGATPGHVVIGTGREFVHQRNIEPVLGEIDRYHGYHLLPSQVAKIHIPVPMWGKLRAAVESGESTLLLFTQVDYESGEGGREFFKQKFRASRDVFKAGRMDEANNNHSA